MITLISGTPGTGKTTQAVSMLVSMLRDGGDGDGADRPIYTHGIPELSLPHLDLANPQEWPEVVDDKAVILVDECQRHFGRTCWSARSRTPPPAFLSAMETHRHRGLDIILITQSPRLLHDNVLAQVGRHIHLRHLGSVLGRRWYEWPEACPALSWKTAPIAKRYSLDKSAHRHYRSAVEHYAAEKSTPMQVWILLLLLPVLGVLVWRVSDRLFSGLQGESSAAAHVSSATGKAGALAAPGSSHVVYRAGEPLPGEVAQPADGAASAPTEEEAVAAPFGSGSPAQAAGCVAVSRRCECFSSSGASVATVAEVCERLQDSRPAAAVTAWSEPFPESGWSPGGVRPAREGFDLAFSGRVGTGQGQEPAKPGTAGRSPERSAGTGRGPTS